MDNMEPDSLVNRDDPIPVLTISDDKESVAQNDGYIDSQSDGKPRKKLSASKLKEDFSRSVDVKKIPSGMQDRLMNSLFQQIFPASEDAEDMKPDRRSRKYVERPNFRLPLMSSNFRRFNSRVGVVFIFQNRLIKLFSWKVPSQTLSFLALYTFCCVDPNLLVVTPIVACLFFIMVPAFLSRHPPSSHDHHSETFAIRGPASAPPPDIKPAPELSKDFFRNMRDLQNGMEDFSVIHDHLIAVVAPLTNFSNERLSSSVFLVMFALSCFLFIASGSVPWRAMFLVIGWLIVCSLHPVVSRFFLAIHHGEIEPRLKDANVYLQRWIEGDISLDEAPEVKEVEIFELQRHQSGGEWQPWMYTNTAFDPLSSSRISGARPRGTQFFEDVKGPIGWEWKDKKWNLDLLSREWVEERMITAVEVETEGERWVYDIAAGDSQTADKHKPDWQEGNGQGPKGQWRRRRWIRLVQRQTSK
ncbi:MAG: hypothetical protein M1831_007505 [Alyxoria varia]|nr:MAG: hypothetical protein M1831_007505 [Alyxoria varia]